MDALDFIQQDHDRFRELLDEYEEIPVGDGDAKRELMDGLIEIVVRHSAMEEEAFYPTIMRELPETEDDILEEIEEHHVIEVIMTEIRQADPATKQYDAKVEVFAENLLHHLAEEEEELFPVLRDKLSSDALESMLPDLQQARDAAPTAPDPDRYGT